MSRLMQVVLLCVLASFGCSRNGDKVESSKKVPQDTKPVHSLLAADLIAERNSDKEAANAKYNEKFIELTGKVWQVSKKDTVWLGGEKDAAGRDQVRCDLNPNLTDMVLRFSIGQKVKVVGKYVEGDLLECKFTELEPTKIQVTAAETLVKECEEHSDIEKKYGSFEDMIVTGVFEEAVSVPIGTEGGGYYAKLKGTDKTRVSIAFAQWDYPEIAKLNRGVNVEIRARFSSGKVEKNELCLYGGTLIKVK